MQTETSITTLSGKWFDILNPENYEYDINEIATALSNLCRYTGHVNTFYSVAEHSVLVSRIVPKRLALAGLLHDATEAYLGDVASPLKKLLPEYKRIEKRVQSTIARYFGLGTDFHNPAIHEADKRMYWQERQGVANNGVRDLLWHQGVRATRKVEAIGMRPEMARRMFLSEYKKIVEERNEKKAFGREATAA